VERVLGAMAAMNSQRQMVRTRVFRREQGRGGLHSCKVSFSGSFCCCHSQDYRLGNEGRRLDFCPSVSVTCEVNAEEETGELSGAKRQEHDSIRTTYYFTQ